MKTMKGGEAMERKGQLQTQQALLGGKTQQTQGGGEAMRELNVELVPLYERASAPSVPWKFVVEWKDYFWPLKWSLFPFPLGDLWLVKKESPWNDLAKEQARLVGIFINGELVFAEPEWNNEILQLWDRKSVLSLFEEVRRGKYSGVVIAENCDKEEREEAEKILRLLRVIRMLLEDRERISGYGENTFSKYIERYYGKWIGEFGGFFERLAKLKGEERVGHLEDIKETLERKLWESGWFMHVYYP
jgi:hypothetical protein